MKRLVRRRRQSITGFLLVEWLLVLAILALMMVLVSGLYQWQKQRQQLLHYEHQQQDLEYLLNQQLQQHRHILEP